MSLQKNSYSISPIEVLTDNIIWVWVIGDNAVVVDPAETEPVLNWLKTNKLNLIGILQTHHHLDHIGGTQGLLNEWPQIKVIASESDRSRIPLQNISVKGGDKISLMGLTVEVLEVAGHTKNHIAFYLPNTNLKGIKPALFCGDTLFAAGCGRLFEGSAKDMFNSLQKLNSLPLETLVFCAHEYTESNLIWAHELKPYNIEIKNRLKAVVLKREKKLITLPTSIKEERDTNLFLQAKSPAELDKLRKHKDVWR